MKNFQLTTLLTFCYCLVFSQLPPIFENTPKQLVKSKVLASYPQKTFLENIVEGHNGNLYVTNYPEGKILQITRDGKKSDYAKVEGQIAGIAKYKKGEFLITGWDSAGKPSVFLVDANKKTSLFAPIPGGMFPNGITPLSGELYLIADSFAGCIWLLDTSKKSVTVWLKHELLERSSPQSQLPAANGLKMHKGNLYVSNSEKQLLIEIPVKNNTAGKPAIYLDHVFIDDFEFDHAGNMYAAANVYNVVLKITPAKSVSVIAGMEEGAAGATSVLILKDKAGKNVVYVPTCGGMGVPPPSGIEDAKILSFDLN